MSPAPAEASIVPSGLNATPLTPAGWPVSSALGWRLATSHSLITVSCCWPDTSRSAQDARDRPSGLNDNALTP